MRKIERWVNDELREGKLRIRWMPKGTEPEIKNLTGQSARSPFRKGSFTVEAAFVVPLLLGVFALLILYAFYEHNRAWYLNAAGEAALVGNSRTYAAYEDAGAAGQLAEEKLAQRIDDAVLTGDAPEGVVTVNAWGSTVCVNGEWNNAFSEQLFDWEETVRLQKVRPVPFMRKCWSAKKWKEVIVGDVE